MDKQRAREFLIKSKLYRFLALVFAGVGLLIFCGLYFQQEKSDGGGFLSVLRDPVLVVLLVFPFVPAIVLSLLAQRAERKLQEFLKD